MGLIDYRSLYESSTSLLLYNVVKDIAIAVSTTGMVKLTRRNKIKWNDKKIVGVLLQENGMFVITDDNKSFELDEYDNEFKDFSSNPLNVITLLENVRKELESNK